MYVCTVGLKQVFTRQCLSHQYVIIAFQVELGQSIDGIYQVLDQHGDIVYAADVSTKIKLRLKSFADIFEIRYMWL